MQTEGQEGNTGSRTMTNSNPNDQLTAPYNKDAPGISARHFSPLRLLATIIGGIFMAEVVAMLVVYVLSPLPYIQLTLIDAGIMTVLIFPLLYFLSFQPLLRYIQKSQQAEAALLRSMDLQERFFDSIDTLIAYMDRDFNFIRVNEAYAKADGQRPEYFIGRNHFELYPHAENQAIFRRVVDTGEAYSVNEKPFEYPEYPERGITYWNWNLMPVSGVNGNVEGVVLSLVNVTERMRAEEKNRQLSRIVEQTADTVVVTDCDGVIEYVNPAFERMTGYTKEETLDKTPRVLKSGVHDDQFYKGLWKTILHGEAFQSEIANRKKNGELFYEEKTITPLRDERGDITHFVATGKDITERKRAEEELRKAYDELEQRVQARTEELRIANSELEEEIIERKQAEEALRESEERYRLALDAAALGTWRHDPATGILSLDERARSHSGFESDTVILPQVLALIHPDDAARVEHEINKVLDPASSTGYYATEYRIMHPESGIRWISVQASASFEGQGTTRHAVQVIGLSQEITERKHAEEALHAANEELMRFNSSMVGRELRMIALKKEVNELCTQTDQPARYPLDFEKDE